MKNILEKIRIEKGFNKKEMSEVLGISDSFYSRIEAGKKPISKKLLDKIITSFNLTDEEIKELKQQQFLIRTPDFLSGELVELSKAKRLEEIQKKKIILKKIGIASAGTGKMNFCDIGETVEVDDQNFNSRVFAMEVEGDSMEPEILEGSIIIIDPDRKEWDDIKGKIALVGYYDEIFVKRVNLNNNGRIILLESINPKYPPITILSEDIENFKCYGKVIAVEYKKYYR